jgi:hypothetical protein
VSESTPEISPPRFMFARLWSEHGGDCIPTTPPERASFVRIWRDRRQVRPLRSTVCFDGEAITRSIRVGKRGVVDPRSVRCRLGMLGEFDLFRCGACGHAEFLPSSAVVGAAVSMCARCKAQLSTLACTMWHTWGTCSECLAEPIESCPFPMSVEGDGVAAASHVG